MSEYKTLVNVNLIKKGRKYWKACIENKSFEFKLTINEMTENYKTGDTIPTLYCLDETVTTRYGTDVKYTPVVKDASKEEKFITLKTSEYNQKIVEKCKKLGGAWDANEQAWIFPSFLEEQVEELDYQINSKPIQVKVRFIDGWRKYCGPLYWNGKLLGRAFDRDGGARIEHGVAVLEGDLTSGGSIKNWTTEIIKNSLLTFEMPENLLSDEQKKELKEKGFITEKDED